MLLQQIDLCPGILKRPVQIIELDLAEFHMLAISVQKAFHNVIASMGGKSQMTDTPFFLLLHQVIENTVFFIQISINIHFTYVVEQIKIKIIHSAFFQLCFKNAFHLVHVG